MSNIASLPTQQRDWVKEASPPWLQTGSAEKFVYTLGLMSDLLLEKCNQAQKIRMPGLGDASQLPYLAADRLLVQGPNETNAQFVARLTMAFQAWKRAGSRAAILGQLQAYAANLQPTVAAGLPEMTIVGGGFGNDFVSAATWDTIYNGQAQGSPPTHAFTLGAGGGINGGFDWDGQYLPWRSWLILYMHLVSAGLGGTSAQTGAAIGNAGDTGYNVSGVWRPNLSNTINTPFLHAFGLSGLSAANVGMWLTVSGSSHAGNNGTFPIVSVASATTCAIANPAGVASDTGPLTWSISSYPWIAPGMVRGAPGTTYGQGANPLPPQDTGSLIQGVWQPSTASGPYGVTASYGLSCSAQTITSIRQILTRWKAAQQYYPNIIVVFDGSTGVAGSAYSPLSSGGSGNPDGTFGPTGKNTAGVWGPTRLISSVSDCYCGGTGTRSNCTVENVT
jgi:hypothetical protein